MNEMRTRRVRVMTDQEGEEFFSAVDIKNLIGSYIKLTQVANWMNPITQLVVQGIASVGDVIMSASDEESPVRVLVSEIDTTVPDTVPTDWL